MVTLTWTHPRWGLHSELVFEREIPKKKAERAEEGWTFERQGKWMAPAEQRPEPFMGGRIPNLDAQGFFSLSSVGV